MASRAEDFLKVYEPEQKSAAAEFLSAYEPTVRSDFPQLTTRKPPIDSWAQLGLKFLKRAPDLFKQVGGGMLQKLSEGDPTPPNLAILPNDPMWQEYVEFHREVRTAARDAGTLPGQKMFEEATADLLENQPNVDGSFSKKLAFDVAEGLTQMIPAVTAGLLTKNPYLSVSIIGTQVYGAKYGESRAAGRSEGQAVADSTFHALAEAIPEIIPMGILIKPGGKFLYRTFAAAGAEGIQEMFTEVFQSAYDIGIIDETTTIGEAMASIEYWQGVGYAGLVGAAVGGGLAIGSQPFRDGGQQQAPPDDAETVTTDEVRDHASKRQTDLEGGPSLQPIQQQELDFLRNNETNPTAIAEAYGAKLEPTGKREEAVAATPPLTQEDIDSPLSTEIIAEGKEVLQDALGGQSANTILEEAGFPKINSRVNVEMDAGPAIATVVDAWDQNGIRGVKLQFDDGRIKSEPFEFLTGRVTPITEDGEVPRGTSEADIDAQAQAAAEEEGRAPEPAAEILAVPPQAPPQQELQPLDTEGLSPVEQGPESTAESKLGDFLEKAARRFAMETQGQGILDEMESENISPQSVSKQFWSDTYFKLNAPTQARFQRMLNGLGFKPGDVGSVEADGTENVLGDWVEVGKFMGEDLSNEAEYLEGTERGYVALMQWANQQATASLPDLLDTKPVKQTAQIVKQPDERQAKALRELALQAGWEEIGGRMIRKTEDVDSPDYSEVVGRTKWLPRADWWPGRPGGFNEKQTAHIIEKGINGKLLGKKQRQYFEFLTEIADEMVAMTAYQPSDLELTDAELEPDADSQFEVELVARAIEIDEDAVEQAAKQYEDDDAGFLRAIKAVVDQTTATDEGRPGRAQAEELDLLGEDTRQAQALADEKRRRDEARNLGQESIETGDPGDLFSQARRQTDIDDTANQQTSVTPELRRATKRRDVLQSLLDCVKS